MMKEIDRRVRMFVYEHFVRFGTPPGAAEVARECSCTRDEVDASLVRLENEHHALTLAPTTTNVWMAHPFSAVPTRYKVEAADVTYWANCAWDAVAIPQMLSVDSRVAARCAETNEPMELAFDHGAIADAPADGVVHFVVPPRAFWNNVGYT